VFALALRRRRWPENAAGFDLVQLGLVLWAIVSLVLLYVAIHRGLLFPPDMQVAGNGSSDAHLAWYADRVDGTLPTVGVVSLPLWIYRVAMLLWAMWLATSLVRAVGWGWRAFGEGGLWKPLVFRRAPRPGPGGSNATGEGSASPDVPGAAPGDPGDEGPGQAP